MESTIMIGEKEVTLNNNIGWTFIYRDQVGTDILPTIMPMVAAGIDAVASVADTVNSIDDIEMKDVSRILKNENIFDALIKLSSFEFVDFVNITWALAKNADESIPEPKRWVKEFEIFPVDTIGPEIISLIVKGAVSSKNWERLQTAIEKMKKLQPKGKKKSQ